MSKQNEEPENESVEDAVDNTPSPAESNGVVSADELKAQAELDAGVEPTVDDEEGVSDDELPSDKQAAESTDETEPDTEVEGDSEVEEASEAETTASTAQTASASEQAIKVDGSVEEIDTQLGELATKQKELDAKRYALEDDWEDGEIEDREEYRKQLQEIRAQEREYARTELALDKQRDRIEMQVEMVENQWRNDTAAFFSANPDYAGSQMLQTNLNIAITELAQDPEWLAKGNTAILAEAREMVDKETGRASVARKSDEPVKPADDKEAKRAALAGRGKKPALPQTLGSVPAAAPAPVDSGDEFTQIDQLTPQKREERLAAMSPKQIDDYLAGTIH